MREKLLAKQWEIYRKRVIPENAHAIQVIESRRAFYAGAECLMVAVMQNLSDGSETTEADLAVMESIDAELKQFVRDVQAGVA